MVGIPTIRFEPPPVYFMHVLKTGGTSLRALLCSGYAQPSVRHADPCHLHEISAANLRQHRCLMSALGPNLLPFLGHEQRVLLTMLREPVERLISQLYYNQSKLVDYRDCLPGAFYKALQPWLQADLRALIDGRTQDGRQIEELGLGDGPKLYGNFQTRFFGTRFDVQPYFKEGEMGRRGEQVWNLWALQVSAEDADMPQVFERACRQLEQMTVVGLTERFHDSAKLIGEVLGIPLPAQLPEQNIGTKKTGVEAHGHRARTPPDLIERIEALEHYDMRLYAYARDLFERQLARQRAQPRRVISLAPRLRQLRQRIRPGINAANQKGP